LQYGLSHIAATRAVVILLFELVVATVAAWFLAGEVAGIREWIGGALIIAASLLSGLMGRSEEQNMDGASGKNNC
jgi:drug/metabolite transporter (DMT)-like permease